MGMFNVYLGLSFLVIALSMAWLSFKRVDHFWRRTFNVVIGVEAAFAILLWLTPSRWM